MDDFYVTFCNNPTCFSFPEEEISNMRSELDKYGIQMPAFSKIGGILANELSVDEAACEFFWHSDTGGFWLMLPGRLHGDGASFFSVHAAVIAINEAIDRGQAPATMAALNNPNAMLKNAQGALAEDYQGTLSQAKARKLHQSSGKVQKPKNDHLLWFQPSFISLCLLNI